MNIDYHRGYKPKQNATKATSSCGKNFEMIWTVQETNCSEQLKKWKKTMKVTVFIYVIYASLAVVAKYSNDAA